MTLVPALMSESGKSNNAAYVQRKIKLPTTWQLASHTNHDVWKPTSNEANCYYFLLLLLLNAGTLSQATPPTAKMSSVFLVRSHVLSSLYNVKCDTHTRTHEPMHAFYENRIRHFLSVIIMDNNHSSHRRHGSKSVNERFVRARRRMGGLEWKCLP